MESESTTPMQETSLALLYELAQVMHTVQNIEEALETSLDLMAQYLGIVRGTITLLSPETNEIRIRTSVGLKETEERRGTYLPGEGITGRVIESGKPICVSNISQEPLFLNRTQSRDLAHETLAFLCVPIMLHKQIVGALSVDHPAKKEESQKALLRLLEIIASILAHAAMESQFRMDARKRSPLVPPGFIGTSSEMQNVYQLINQVASSQATVLLEGESGTGKELAALAIHAESPRSAGPFISLNCAALPDNLIESELFGHVRGAFTGAHSLRKGRFELADHGTLFLDEVGELAPLTQAKLLRVLQTKSFERIGDTETRHVDVRIICATNRDLSQMIEDGSFRQDLYYRINVFPIHLPPLRKRSDDILALCNHFLRKFARENAHPPIRLSNEAMDLLQIYDWPGNIRELENVMIRAVLLAGHDSSIQVHHLPPHIQNLSRTPPTATLPETIERIEKEAITQAMQQSEGKLRSAAKILGITERMLGYKMKKYSLSYKDFRTSQ